MNAAEFNIKDFLRAYASELIDMAYRGILKRNPDQDGRIAFSTALKKSEDMSWILEELSFSDEHWRIILAARHPGLIRAIYKRFHGREVDLLALQKYSKTTMSNDEFVDVLVDLDTSVKLQMNQGLIDPALSFEKETLVFMHLQKTAGTSVRNMLLETYGVKEFYQGYEPNQLWQNPLGMLSTYSVFAGHFDFDSLAYIPRRRLSIFTFLREPKKRLTSLYYFWRAAEPTSDTYVGVRLANELTMESFLDADKIKSTVDIWNHMTWAIMGDRQWRAWQIMLGSCDKDSEASLIAKTIRPAIKKRLREFMFIGLQEDFDRSVNLLFQMLKRTQPAAIRADNISIQKETIGKQPMTERLNAQLERLVVLDKIVYEEAKKLYKVRLREFPLSAEVTKKVVGLNESVRKKHKSQVI